MKQTQIFVSTLALLMMILQITPLFWNRSFYLDWTNHIWAVEYYAKYFSQHFQFPTTIDVDFMFGNPLPSFCCIFFYPFLALFSIFIDSDLVMRVFCGGILIAPMIAYTKLFSILTKDLSFSILLAIIVNSSIYQITNLYTRNAITEFAAYQFFILSVALILVGILRKSNKGNAIISLGFACLALALGFHPITFYTLVLFCLPSIFMLGISFKRFATNGQLLQILVYCGCIVLMLTPWILNVLKYAQHLSVQSAFNNVLIYFPSSIDSIKSQIGLFYLDVRVLAGGITTVSAPFLEAPFALNIVLILFAIFFVCLTQRVTQTKKWSFILTIGLTALTAFVIIFARSYYNSNSIEILRKILFPIQFAYRLANTFAIVMIIALIVGLLVLNKITPSRKQKRFLLNVSFISAFLGIFCMGQKLFDIAFEFLNYPDSHNQPYQLQQESHLAMVRNIERYPTTFYAAEEFTMKNFFPYVTYSDAVNRQLINVSVKNWDTIVPFTCNTTCLLKTNIAPIVFYDILLDGLPTKILTLENRITLLTDSGPHTLEISKPSNLHKFILISIWTALLWFTTSLFVVFYLFLKSRINVRGKILCKKKAILFWHIY